MFDTSSIEVALADSGRAVKVTGIRQVAGGSINQAAVVQTSGGEFFVKGNDRPIPDQFAREAEGLSALRAADSGLVIPKPIAWRATFLVLEYLPSSTPASDYQEQLGRGLAALHSTTAFDDAEPRFGFAHDNYCGATPQPNPWEESWISFYREHRLRHMVELADRDRGWSRGDRAKFDRLFDRLDEFLVDGTPSLIHGDLWSGNAHVGPAGRASVIDPAAHFGHREAELGMMSLFGGFGSRVWDSYLETMPLESGWRERIPLYELYHVLNHYVLFGGSYGAQAVRIAASFV